MPFLQLKALRNHIETTSKAIAAETVQIEEERYKHLIKIGNLLHPSVPISDDEVPPIDDDAS